jgi:hypothetical protein
MTAEKSDQWYSNKELYEKFLCMFKSLEKELKETRDDVKRYNGLVEKQEALLKKHEQIEEACKNVNRALAEQVRRCDEVQAIKVGKWDLVGWIVKLWPIALSTVIFILAMLKVVN